MIVCDALLSTGLLGWWTVIRWIEQITFISSEIFPYDVLVKFAESSIP